MVTRTLAPAGHTSRLAPLSTARHELSIDDLRQAADRFGQLDVGDPRWASVEEELDDYLWAAVRMSRCPQSHVWRAIATDVTAPLVVKLRVLGVVVASLALQG